MGLSIPGVGVTAGPSYATDVNNSLTTIDGHTHSPGSGVPVTPSGLNINADLPIGGYNLTLIRTTRFQSLSATLTNTAPDVGCVYIVGNELYFNDYSGGHNVQITNNGNVNAGAGSITGLPSGTASVNFTSAKYVFQSATSIAAVLDCASLIIRNTTASSNGLTLQAPSGLGSNYSITLPTVPAQTNVMTLTSAGNMGSINYDAVGQAMTSVGADAIGVTMDATGANAVANTRTRATGSTVAAGGVALCATGSSNYFTNSGTFVSVPNMTFTITTTGRPVQLYVQAADNSDLCFVGASTVTGVSAYAVIGFVRGSTQLSQNAFQVDPSDATNYVAPGCLNYIDIVAAGTYTYTLNVYAVTGGFAHVSYCKIGGYEL